MPLRRKPSGGSSHQVLLFGSNTQLRKRRLIGARRSRSHLNKGQRFSVVAYQINFALCTARNVVPRDKHAANTNTQMSPTHSPSPRFSFAFASVPLPRSVRVVRATSPAQMPVVKIAPPRFPKTKVSPSKWPIKGIAFACEYNLVSDRRTCQWRSGVSPQSTGRRDTTFNTPKLRRVRAIAERQKRARF
jgi:hypothetical protein